MPPISVLHGIVIRMFFRDHAPALFHAAYGEFAVLEWAALHREELRADWEQCRRHEQPTRIAPLE